VVDDERSVRKRLRLYLEREGYTAAEALVPAATRCRCFDAVDST